MATTRDDWIAAAYARFADEGLSAVRIEPIARAIGATKGSFYWHFTDRQALIEAVMERWEQSETDAIIEVASAGTTPRERLALLYRTVGETSSRRRGEASLYFEAAAHGVAAYVTRVSERRVVHIASILEEADIAPDEARRRAVLSLAIGIGLEQLTTATGLDVVGDTSANSRQLTETALRAALQP